MKKLFRHNFDTLGILLIILITFQCTNKSIDCTVDLKINGKYEVNFYDTQKELTSGNETEFNQTIQFSIKDTDILDNKSLKEIHRNDKINTLVVSLYPKPDSINKTYNIKSTITIDTVIFNGSYKFFKKDEINHTVSGHTNHEISEIINNKDTLNWIVKTKLNFNLYGQVKGKGDDLLVYYLTEKELSDHYIPEILNLIKNKK